MLKCSRFNLAFYVCFMSFFLYQPHKKIILYMKKIVLSGILNDINELGTAFSSL